MTITIQEIIISQTNLNKNTLILIVKEITLEFNLQTLRMSILLIIVGWTSILQTNLATNNPLLILKWDKVRTIWTINILISKGKMMINKTILTRIEQPQKNIIQSEFNFKESAYNPVHLQQIFLINFSPDLRMTQPRDNMSSICPRGRGTRVCLISQ